MQKNPNDLFGITQDKTASVLGEYISLPTQFLADRTIGRAIGTVCRL